MRKAPEERRAEIDEAARALALTDGLAAVTLRGVATRAGVTPALVAHYRPNMDELVAKTFRSIVAAELREVAGAHSAGLDETRRPPADDRVPGGTPGVADSPRDGRAPRDGEAPRGGAPSDGEAPSGGAPSDGEAPKDGEAPVMPATERIGALVYTLLDASRDDVTLVWVEAWALGRRNETLAAAVREQMDAWQAVLHDLIAVGVEAGEFEVDDPAAVAWQLLGMIDGLNAQALVRWGKGRTVLLTHALEGMLGLSRGALDHASGNAR